MRPMSSSSPCASSAVTSARGIGRLLVNGCRLGFGNEFLKTWIIADRVPDRVDLQPRNGNDSTGRSRDQLAKYFYSFISLAGARFNFGQSGKKTRATNCIFFDWQ